MKRTFKLSTGVFGEGDPKICAPIVGRTKEDIFKAADRESADGSEKKHCFSRSGQSMKVDSLQ